MKKRFDDEYNDVSLCEQCVARGDCDRQFGSKSFRDSCKDFKSDGR
jgi:hypothetical protein